jgi:hypothetical protein
MPFLKVLAFSKLRSESHFLDAGYFGSTRSLLEAVTFKTSSTALFGRKKF